VNRFRVVPQLKAAAAGGSTPGAVGVLLRRTLRTEMAVGVAVFGVAGALGTYAPAKVADTGPISINTILGPARLQATLDPAKTGVNEMHLYLFDRQSGAQWTKAKELTATASLPSRHISGLPIDLRKAGPGHYVAGQVSLPSPGTWELHITARVSDFDEYQKTIKLKVR
jgi:copper transport protein